MKIIFKMDGGFAYLPALSKPSVIDTALLDPQAANQLENLVRECSFYNQPARVGSTAKGAADHQTYTISVEDNGRSHTIQLTDPIEDANLHRLVSHLRNMARSVKR
jgi:hypothetical protein